MNDPIQFQLTSKPVLEGHHKGTGISSLVTGEEFEYLGKSTEKLEHTLLEGGAILLLLLLHEVGNDGLGLSQVLHGEGTDLVQAHNLRHGGEDKDSIELITERLDNLDNLLGEFLNKDEGTNEDIGLTDILLELLKGSIVTKLF